jgi:hypothetical protein
MFTSEMRRTQRAWNNILGHPLDLSLFASNVSGEKYYLATGGVYQSFG